MDLHYLDSTFDLSNFKWSPPHSDGDLQVRLQLWQRLAMYDEESRWVLYAKTAEAKKPMWVVRKEEILRHQPFDDPERESDWRSRLMLRQSHLDEKTLLPLIERLEEIRLIPSIRGLWRLGSDGLQCGVEFGTRGSSQRIEWLFGDEHWRCLEEWWQTFTQYLDECLDDKDSEQPQ